MKCPVCQKPVQTQENNPFLPFCCERCKLVDLGKWLDEKYVIPGDHPASFSDHQDEDKD